MVFIFNKKAPSNKSGGPQIQCPAQRTSKPIGGEARSDIQGIVNSLLLEPGDSSTTDDSVLADKTKQEKTFRQPSHLASGAIGRAAKRHQEAGDRTSKCLDWVNRKLRRLLERLGIDMQRHMHDPSPKPAQPSLGHGTRSDDTNGLETSHSPAGHPRKDLDTLGQRQQRAQKPGKSTKPSYDEAVRGDNNAVLKRTGNDANGLASGEASGVQQHSTGQAPGHQQSITQFGSNSYSQPPMQSQTNTPATALALQTLESSDVQEGPPVTEGPSSNTVVQPGGRDFKTTFRMVIHLAGDEIAQRVSCLDTGADLDVINHRVVESLRLQRDRYQGAAIYPLGGFYEPEWQVTFDWHVAGFRQTYTSTLAVLDDRHSGDFDVLLGRMTIQKIGFYMTNDRVWMLSTDNEAQPLHCLSEHEG